MQKSTSFPVEEGQVGVQGLFTQPQGRSPSEEKALLEGGAAEESSLPGPQPFRTLLAPPCSHFDLLTDDLGPALTPGSFS